MFLVAMYMPFHWAQRKLMKLLEPLNLFLNKILADKFKLNVEVKLFIHM